MTHEDFLYQLNKMLVPLLEQKLKKIDKQSFEESANDALERAQNEVLPNSIDAILRNLFPEEDVGEEPPKSA